MSNAAPTVSIAIRAYRRRWLGEAIRGVLSQTYRDLELVVYDDAGDLEDLVGEFGDPRVRYHRPTRRLGTASAKFHAAVSLCRGRYIGVLDDDDRYEPEFVARLVAALERHPGAGIAFCRVVYDVDGRRYIPPDPRAPGRQPDAVRQILAYRAVITPSVMLVRRAALEAAEAHRPMPDGVAPDAFLNVHVAVAGWGHVRVDAPLSVRRWHRGQISNSRFDSVTRTVETWRLLSVGDGELDELRRRVLARKLLWRATYELSAGRRGDARATVSEARDSDAATWRVPRALIAAATRLPGIGQMAARMVLALVRFHERRSGPPAPAREVWS